MYGSESGMNGSKAKTIKRQGKKPFPFLGNLAIALLFLFFIPLTAIPGQSQKILPLSSDVYVEMDALYLIRGLATPSTSRPWTVSEARMILDRIDASFLNYREKKLYDSIAAEINKPLRFLPENDFSFEVALDLALEAYAHTNTEDFVLGEDWGYGYEERQPPIKLSVEMGLYSWFYFFTDMQYGRNRYYKKDSFRSVEDINQTLGAETSFSYDYSFPWKSWAYGSSFITNIPMELDEFDFDWPKRAAIAVGGEHWNLNIARDKIQWGRGHSGNFVMDSHRDYDEYARFSAYSDRFKYEWLNVFYPVTGVDGVFKFFMAHRLEFRILPSLVFAISEDVMCRSEDFNLRYINPAFIYHQWYDRSVFNSLAHMELDFVPFGAYRLYSQLVIDQFEAPWESADEPAAWGILAGVEHARPASAGILCLSLEWAYTSPLLYRRDLLDFITLSAVNVNGASRNINIDYTGYPYGGDAMVLQLDANCLFPGSAFVHARLFGMIHGKMNYFISHNSDGDNSAWANLKSHTPSGDKDEREYTFGFSLGGNYSIPQPVSWFTMNVWTEIDFFFKKNKVMLSETGTNENIIYHKKGGASDFQFTVGLGIRI